MSGEGKYAYVACQGPVPTSFYSHWQMVWESGAEVIVMVTNEVGNRALAFISLVPGGRWSSQMPPLLARSWCGGNFLSIDRTVVAHLCAQ